jgi:protein SCO1/2
MPLPLPRSRKTLALLCGCLAMLVLAAGFLLLQPRPMTAASAIGGPFALTDQDGHRVTQADMAGHPFLVFFGYTHCPDVCPTTLSDLSRVLDALGKTAPVKALFVTVDPERDTPAVLKDYLSSFDPRITGLTGDPAAVAAAEKAYRVYARKVPGKDGNYSIDHTAVVYLMDADGRFVNALDLGQPPETVAATVKQVM